MTPQKAADRSGLPELLALPPLLCLPHVHCSGFT